MNKPFNLRLPVLFAGALASGIVCSTVLTYFALGGTLIFIPTIITLTACVILLLVKRRTRTPLIFIFAAIAFAVGAVYTFVRLAGFTQPEIPLGELCRITGRVEEVGYTSGGTRYVVITNASVYGTKLKGKVIAYLAETAGDYCRRGYTVEFYSTLRLNSVIDFGSLGYQVCKNYKYFCNVYGSLQSTYHFSLFGEINYAIENALFNNLDGETAALCFAMLTGNTDAVSHGTLAAFRNGGVAHVFAVSGLHIGVIFGVLLFLGKKLHINRFVTAGVCTAFVFLYSGVCGFSTSSLRAAIMCAVTSLSACTFRKRDGLNALSVAAIILLAINPLSLFEAGFMLSFGCVLGILLLANNVSRVLTAMRIPKKLSSALSVGISAQMSTAPVSFTVFGYNSATGLAINLIFIPIVSVLYVILFAAAMLGAACPFLAKTVLPIACVPIQFVMNVFTHFGFESSVTTANFSNWFYVPFILAALAVTDKINTRPLIRAALAGLTVLAILFAIFSGNGKTTQSLTFGSGYNGGFVTVKTEAGTVLVVSGDYDVKNRPRDKIDVLVVLGEDDWISVLNGLGGAFDKVYMRGNAINLPVVGSSPVYYSDEFDECGIHFEYCENSLFITVDGITVSLVTGEKGSTYAENLSGCAIDLYCHDGDGAVLFYQDKSYGLEVVGDMRFEIAGGKLLPSYAIPRE